MALWLVVLFAMATHVQSTSIQRVHGVGQDPEVYMNVTQLITSKGYPCEEHEVTTDDGFILGLQRIPHGRLESQKVYYPVEDQPVVLLQHGLLSCSSCWLDNLVNESLGYLMADNGIDVWLGNNRGNIYSRKHKTLSPDDPKFWEWSWDEMALYDMPAMIDYILNVTNRKQLYYLGYSQGTQIAFSGLSQPWNTDKVKMFFAFAPVTNLGGVISPIRLLAPFVKPLQTFFELFGTGEFLPSTDMVKWLGREVCSKPGLDFVCENFLFVLGGYDFKQFNKSRIPVYVANHPAGTSVQNIAHYAQSILHKDFLMYDFGSEAANLDRYNQTTPPAWNASLVKTPTVVYSGSMDWLADPDDVRALLPKITNLVASKVMDEWQHLDFIWAMDAPQQVYRDVIRRIHQQEAVDHNST
ncbi:lysosomal acid lipase/cholesteryl ester hydrolase-like [Ylistrum balloti]|uniref:lysosomal acid lipase/cholesteryl ester hydrolase-like n=1 Tax=Ylistrum balloti TaxID=509963 RepID=UPI00290595CA|nr:lysosomal acid lipase/cholesteryl ester hydrolase-like [Ylistrum balloti]